MLGKRRQLSNENRRETVEFTKLNKKIRKRTKEEKISQIPHWKNYRKKTQPDKNETQTRNEENNNDTQTPRYWRTRHDQNIKNYRRILQEFVLLQKHPTKEIRRQFGKKNNKCQLWRTTRNYRRCNNWSHNRHDEKQSSGRRQSRWTISEMYGRRKEDVLKNRAITKSVFYGKPRNSAKKTNWNFTTINRIFFLRYLKDQEMISIYKC